MNRDKTVVVLAKVWSKQTTGASIRVPSDVEKNGWVGYLEDRRPASNCDPYRVAKVIVEAVENL